MKKRFLVLMVAILALSLMVFALSACNDDTKGDAEVLRFAVPDGTPALSVAGLIASGATVGGKKIELEIINPSLIGGEVLSEKADIAILPTNAAAQLYNRGAKYKLVTSNVFGVLYLIGKENPEGFMLDKLIGKRVSSIGQSNTPQFVFEKILKETFGGDIIVNNSQSAVEGKIVINYVADGASAIAAVNTGNADYAIVGEPAVTNAEKAGFKPLYDLQAGWAQVTGKDGGYPQASMIVKEKYANDAAFIEALVKALEDGLDYINNEANRTGLTELLSTKGSTTAFPKQSIDNCNIKVIKAKDVKDAIESYLSEFLPNALDKLPDNGFYYGLD